MKPTRTCKKQIRLTIRIPKKFVLGWNGKSTHVAINLGVQANWDHTPIKSNEERKALADVWLSEYKLRKIKLTIDAIREELTAIGAYYSSIADHGSAYP